MLVPGFITGHLMESPPDRPAETHAPLATQLIPAEASCLLIQCFSVVSAECFLSPLKVVVGEGQRAMELANLICSVVWLGHLWLGQCWVPSYIGASRGRPARGHPTFIQC